MPQNGHFAGRATTAPRRTLAPLTGGMGNIPKAETAASAISKARANGSDRARDYGHGGRTIRVGKNKDVVIAGNPYDFFYANHDGWLFRYKILHKGGRQIVDFVLPGDIFALQACLFKSSLYSIATVTPSVLSIIPFDKVDEVFRYNHKLSKLIFWSSACEAARFAEHLTDAGRRSAYERVSHLLLELFFRLKAVGLTDGMSFHMPLTQELIGDALGLTTIHVNRTLRLLRDDHLIDIVGKRVTISDFEALSLLSDFETSYLGESARAMRAAASLP
jgi:CRP-like cAMP-binding protein